jgi:FkbM family methyltransferase
MSLAAQPETRFVQARHGAFHILAADTIVGRSLSTYGEWTEPEIELLTRLLRPGDMAVDVGAYLGTHTIPLARAVGPRGAVLAFEPQPVAMQLLNANLAGNAITNVKLSPTLCGAAHGFARLPTLNYDAPGNFGGTAFAPTSDPAVERLPMAPLDDLVPGDRLRLIKVDAEGMEAAVVRGARGLIDRFRPILYVENEWPERSPELLGLAAELGYAAYWHSVPLFNAGNARGIAENIFGAAQCINTLWLPTESQIAPDLVKVRSVDEHPRKRRLAQADVLAEKAAAALCAQAQAMLAQGRFGAALSLAERALAMRPVSEIAASLRDAASARLHGKG